MIRVLHIVSPGTGDYGGIEAFLSGYYEFMDKSKIKFDFSFCGKNTMRFKMQDELFTGSSFTEYNALKSRNNSFRNWFVLIESIRKQLKDSKYDVIEIHSASPLILACCGWALIGCRSSVKIAHSHALATSNGSVLAKMLRWICTSIIQGTYDYYFSCSNAAATVFGKKVIVSDKYFKIFNAIPERRFVFNQTIRDNIRKSFNLDQTTTVIGHVARLSVEKNQEFLVEVFNAYHKKNGNSVLWIVGEGNNRINIEKRIKKLNLQSDVLLFGERRDVAELLQAMDIFLITSFGEGLCISAIESQAAGLRTIVSNGVPNECGITDLFFRLPLEDGPDAWGDFISTKDEYERKDTIDEIRSSGYDIEMASSSLQELYCLFREKKQLNKSKIRFLSASISL